MAGHVRYTALLDARVLVPAATTAALMSLTAAGIYAAKWSTRIELELRQVFLRNRQDISEDALNRRLQLMRCAAIDWEVPEVAWLPISHGLKLPDQNDIHVLAAAIAGHADCIVTSNLRDFPPELVASHGIETIHPDTFVANQWDLDPIAAAAVFTQMRARRRKPEESALEFALTLERNGLVATAERLKRAAELI